MITDDLLKRNVSDVFMVPLLKIGRGEIDRQGYIQSFMYNAEESVVYENALHLLFMPFTIEDFNLFVERERARSKAFICELDYPNNLVVLVYQLPPKFKSDYEKIWQGRYSEVSEAYKSAIPSVIKLQEGNRMVNTLTVQHMVFGKLDVLKTHWETLFNVELGDDQELFKKPTIDLGTFKFKDYEHYTRSAQRVENP